MTLRQALNINSELRSALGKPALPENRPRSAVIRENAELQKLVGHERASAIERRVLPPEMLSIGTAVASLVPGAKPEITVAKGQSKLEAIIVANLTRQAASEKQSHPAPLDAVRARLAAKYPNH